MIKGLLAVSVALVVSLGQRANAAPPPAKVDDVNVVNTPSVVVANVPSVSIAGVPMVEIASAPPAALPVIGRLTVGAFTGAVTGFGLNIVGRSPGAPGAGGGSIAAQFGPMTVTRNADALSGVLFMAAARGQHFDSVVLDLLSPGSSDLATTCPDPLGPATAPLACTATYRLSNAHVLSLSFGGGSLGESVSFQYTRIEEWLYIVGQTAAYYCWDVATNARC